MDRHDWDERYAGAELVWSAGPNQFVEQYVSTLPPGRCIDIACGEGRNAIWMAERGWRSEGSDFSRVALDKAARIAESRQVAVTWRCVDVVEDQPEPGAFDLVVMAYLQIPAAERRRVIAHAVEALVPGGHLFLVGHALSNLTEGVGGPKDPAALYEPDDLRADIGAIGSGVVIERCEHVRRSVTTDSGPRDAIDTVMVARRT
jgi:SAM-dependent methyltransferase